MDFLRRPSRETTAFIIVLFLYLFLVFVLPADQSLTRIYGDGGYRILSFLVKLPLVLVWSLAYISYRKMSHYADRIGETDEGRQYTRLSNGLRWLAWGLPAPALFSTITTGLATHGALHSLALIITNYLYLIGAIVAFSYIGNATHGLAQHSAVRLSIRQLRGLVAFFVTFSVILCFLTADRLHGNSAGDTQNAFHMPNLLVWLTIIGPYLYTWFIGLFAALEIIAVARQTSGIIYRHALQFLVSGVLTIIIAMIMLQYFRSIIPRNGHVVLNGSLMATYVIYALYAAGWILMMIGSQRLKRIEEV